MALHAVCFLLPDPRHTLRRITCSPVVDWSYVSEGGRTAQPICTRTSWGYSWARHGSHRGVHTNHCVCFCGLGFCWMVRTYLRWNSWVSPFSSIAIIYETDSHPFQSLSVFYNTFSAITRHCEAATPTSALSNQIHSASSTLTHILILNIGSGSISQLAPSFS